MQYFSLIVVNGTNNISLNLTLIVDHGTIAVTNEYIYVLF
jgi:hypothetical protein